MRLDGRASVKKDKNARLTAGMLVQVNIPAPAAMELVPENIPLEIVYEDNDLLVVNKPKEWLCIRHPAIIPGHWFMRCCIIAVIRCRELAG